MVRLRYSCGIDEHTVTAIFVKGLRTEVDVPKGNTVGYGKNRAIDKMWKQVPFCHAATALTSLTIYDAATFEEVDDEDVVREGAHYVLAHQAPTKEELEEEEKLSKSKSAEYMFGASKLPETAPAENTPVSAAKATAPEPTKYTCEDLQKLSVKELRKIIQGAGGSCEGCLEKSDLVECALRVV
mmetsp:Transcript_75160/g.141764  ORF Transcript_75160/g.141764 Transcript_75160/m.141764 type:complete len:184 (-) Transcript_75160:94-645(-)